MRKNKHFFIIGYAAICTMNLLFGFAACTKMQSVEEITARKTENVTDPRLEIIPGKSIGKVRIDGSSESLSYLGNPDTAESAMGKSWMTWFSKNSISPSGKYELNIFTQYADAKLSQKAVKMIRVTSPDFRTADGINPGSDSSEVFKKYPNLKYAGKFVEADQHPLHVIYTDDKSGIAVEIDREIAKCAAIIVFDSGEGLMPIYSYLRPDMERE